jgi:SAM-dependent MidA family methyltransferase
LWNSIRTFYDRPVENVWEGRVPFRVTSGPLIAGAYADLIAAYAEDWSAWGGAGALNVLELGAGHGYFSEALLRAFALRRARFQRCGTRVHLFVTDQAEACLRRWQRRSTMAKAMSRGECSFSLLDAALVEGSLPEGGFPGAPWVFIANYVFDSLPQDAFLFEEGGARRAALDAAAEGRIRGAEPDALEPELTFRDFDPADLEEPLRSAFDRAAESSTNGCLLLPTGALRCVERLRRASGGRCLIVASDKAWTRSEDAIRPNAGEAAAFTDASMMVNFGALNEQAERRGGVAFAQQTQQETLATAAWAFGLPKGALARTGEAFSRELDERSPGDLDTVLAAALGRAGELGLGTLVAALKVARWDPAAFDRCYEAMFAAIPTAPPTACADLARGLPEVVRQRCVGEWVPDTLARAGVLRSRLGDVAGALAWLEQALKERAGDVRAQLELGRCLAAVGRYQEARQYLASALESGETGAQEALAECAAKEADAGRR